MFHAVLRRSGPRWDPSLPLEEQSDWPEHAAFMDALVDAGFVVLGGPLADEHRVVHVVEADSTDAVRTTFARDPSSQTHLVVDTIEPWTIRLDRTPVASRASTHRPRISGRSAGRRAPSSRSTNSVRSSA